MQGLVTIYGVWTLGHVLHSMWKNKSICKILPLETSNQIKRYSHYFSQLSPSHYNSLYSIYIYINLKETWITKYAYSKIKLIYLQYYAFRLFAIGMDSTTGMGHLEHGKCSMNEYKAWVICNIDSATSRMLIKGWMISRQYSGLVGWDRICPIESQGDNKTLTLCLPFPLVLYLVLEKDRYGHMGHGTWILLHYFLL